MSMNLYVKATRTVSLKQGNKKNKKETQRTSFGLWQTPTDITLKCLNSNNCVENYIQWVLESSNSFAAKHVEGLNIWIKEREDEGYKVEFYTI